MCRRSELLIQSLQESPLLVDDLPEAARLDRRLLNTTRLVGVDLNFEQKLGHLYEDALTCLLERSGRVELLGSRVQVMHAEGRTLGEFDFLLLDLERARVVHLELAVKFYLAVRGGGFWRFPGPDARDDWQRKLARMRTHQLQLARSVEGRALIQERYGAEIVDVQQLIYGCLFWPMSFEGQRLLPEAIAQDARMGRWLYLSEWELYFESVSEVLLIPKALWPVELGAESVDLLESVSIYQIQAMAQERCVLFTLSDSLEPVFLVPDSWPG